MSGRCAIWFGILVVKMVNLFDYAAHWPELFCGCCVRHDISVQDVFRGVTPFFIADALTIAGLIAFPQIVLCLPSPA